MARVYVERRELPAELLRLLDTHPAAAECTPPLDIVETDAGIEAVLDVPGGPGSSIEIVLSRNVLLVTGRSCRPSATRNAAFHIAERSFGRFARAIAVDGFDAGRATATLANGELASFCRAWRSGAARRSAFRSSASPRRSGNIRTQDAHLSSATFSASPDARSCAAPCRARRARVA